MGLPKGKSCSNCPSEKVNSEMGEPQLIISRPGVKLNTTDFGMSKVLENPYYRQENATIAIRWAAPEVLNSGTFSVASGTIIIIDLNKRLLVIWYHNVGGLQGTGNLTYCSYLYRISFLTQN